MFTAFDCLVNCCKRNCKKLVKRLSSLSLTKYQALKAVLTLATDASTALPLGKKHPSTKLNNQLGVPQQSSGHFGEETSLLLLTKPQKVDSQLNKFKNKLYINRNLTHTRTNNFLILTTLIQCTSKTNC